MSRLVEMDERDIEALKVAQGNVKYRLSTLANAAGTIRKVNALAEVVMRLGGMVERYDDADDREPIVTLEESADVYTKRCQPGGDLYRACSGPLPKDLHSAGDEGPNPFTCTRCGGDTSGFVVLSGDEELCMNCQPKDEPNP